MSVHFEPKIEGNGAELTKLSYYSQRRCPKVDWWWVVVVEGTKEGGEGVEPSSFAPRPTKKRGEGLEPSPFASKLTKIG